jgi:hypothetical protein
MKECDNSTRKIHISSNFVLPISLLIMFDTLLLRQSLHCNTPLHFTQLHFTTLHYTSLHFTILHYTSLHFTTLHFTSPHFTILPLTSIYIPSLNPAAQMNYFTLLLQYTFSIFRTIHTADIHVMSFSDHVLYNNRLTVQQWTYCSRRLQQSLLLLSTSIVWLH